MPFIKTGSLRVKAFSERGDLNLSAFRERKAAAGQEVAAIDPNFLYVWVTGLHGDEPNQNGDYFPWTELIRPHHQIIGKAVYATWIGCPNLCDHDHKRVVGTIIDSGPVPDQKAIDMVVKIDKRVHADLCNRIKAGQQTALSMGCIVQRSYCSLCGNEAHNEAEWCECLSPQRLNLKGKVDHRTGKYVYEDNRDVTGEEVSWITFGEAADPKALTREVLASQAKKETNVDDLKLLVEQPRLRSRRAVSSAPAPPVRPHRRQAEAGALAISAPGP